MAITAEQAAQLASTYQAGDTSGLQGLVNQYGVTSGDVAQYFPGFDVASSGVALPSSSYSSPNFGTGAQAKFDKFADIIGSGGTLTKNQEAKLSNLSTKAGQDLAAMLNYTPTSNRYSYVAPTYGPQNVSGTDISNFIQQNLSNPEAIAQAAQQYGISSGDIAAATGYTPTQQASYFEQAGMLPTTSAFGYDLFPELKTSQEKKLEQLVNLLALGQELTPSQAAKLTKFGSQTGYDFFNTPTYASLEKSLGERTGGVNFQAIRDYVGQNIEDPTKIYQRATELGISPEDVLMAYSATGKKGQSPYSLEQIKSAFETGKTGYGDTFNSLLANTFGIDALSSAATKFKSEDFANKSIESIQQTLQNSTENKNQEALRLAGVLANVYGYDQQTAFGLAKDLASGTVKDESIMSVYNELLKQNKLTPELQTQLLQHVAQTTPDAKFFKDNPDLLEAYTPIEIKEAPKAPGQYGYKNNAPILSAKVADDLLKNEVFQGGGNYFGYGGDGKKDDALGWDLRSKYVGSIANGAGIFGVKATNQEITDFDRIDNEIKKLGGVKTEVDSEGNQRNVVYKEVTDSETGQKVIRPVDVATLFVGDEGIGEDKYQKYVQTKDALAKGAEQLGIDPTKFSSVKGLFDAVDNKSQNLYVVTGRANNWDPTVAEEQGITGVGRDRGGINHAQVLYQKVGDKLMPVQTLKTFNFDDPNTTSGVLGDMIQGFAEIMSAPPLQLAFAMAGGWPALLEGTLGTEAASMAASNLASSIGSSVLDSTGLGAALANTGLSFSEIGGIEALVGRTLLNAGTSALNTGIMTGDLEKAGIAGLSGGIGAGVSGGLPMLLGDVAKDLNISQGALKIASEIAGGAAATAVTGQDPGQYAINRLLSTGIGALMSMGAEQAGIPTKGPGAELLKAMMPIITSKKVGPEDVVRLTKAVAAFESKQA